MSLGVNSINTMQNYHLTLWLLYLTCFGLSLSNTHPSIYFPNHETQLMKHNNANKMFWLSTAELFNSWRPHKGAGASPRKWDTALESWNMSKRLGEILLNTASWHLLLSALTRKRLPRLTCIFVIQASALLAVSVMMSVERRPRCRTAKSVV